MPIAADAAGWRRPGAPPATLAVSTAAVALFSAIRALRRGYLPLEDNAVTAIRAADVLSAHPPLTGMVSSASQVGRTVAHPGPLQLDLLALPVRVLPDGAGLAVGTALINGAAVLALAWCARRAAGAGAATIWVAGAAVLAWALGSEALYEAWQPIATIFPFLLLLVAAWAFAAGHDEVAPVVVVAGSFAVQTHGSHLLVVPALVVAAAAWRLTPLPRTSLRWRPLAVAGALGVVLWVQPLIDQFAGTGNLGRILSHAGGSEQVGTTGFADAARAVAAVLLVPPWWLRPGDFDPGTVPLAPALAGLVGLLAALVAAAAIAVRRGAEVLAAGAVVGAVAVVAATASVAALPVDAFGLSAHRVRWLWPVGVYLVALALTATVRAVGAGVQRACRLSILALGAIAVVATAPTSWTLLSPQQWLADSYPAAAQLRRSTALLGNADTVYVNMGGRPFPDPYHDVLAAALVDRGVEVRVGGAYAVAQYGGHRRLRSGGGTADVTVHVFVGAATASLPPPFREVARFDDRGGMVVLAVAEGVSGAAPSG